MSPAVDGEVAAGFEPVLEALADTIGDEGGAAFAATVDGRPVVDLWGGLGFGRETIQLVFSGSKGLVAVCMLLLLERGALELDAPARRYWPELTAGVTVGQIVSHAAGLPGLRDGFTAGDLLDGAGMRERVAVETPFWEPGTTLAYHALTFGWLCDGLVRRVDGRGVGRLFADEVAGPLDLELWIGLPPREEPRVAPLVPAPDYGITYVGDGHEPLLAAVFGGSSLGFPWNDSAYRRAEIPAANAIGSARSIARLYGCLARGGEIDGVRILAEETVRLGASELSRGTCAITRRPYAFGAGFELQTALGTLGPPADAFGHTGSGGSSHGCWPAQRVGFSYATTELLPEARDDRARRVLAALARSPGLRS